MDAGSTPAYSTTPRQVEHLSVAIWKTRIYLICGYRNPYDEVSEYWQNCCNLSIGGIRKWVKKEYGLDISKSSVCSVRDKCGATEFKVGAATLVPKLKTEKEQAGLAAFRYFGMI